jgi:hypothetical protein
MIADTYQLTPAEKQVAISAWKDGWYKLVRDGKVEEGFGGRFSDGVDYARRAWNYFFPDKKVRTYRGLLPRYDTESNLHLHFYRAMYSGWMIMFGGYIDNSFKEDLLDGVINNNAKPEGKGVYGHARNMFGYETNMEELGGIVKIDDNYAKMSGFTNRYQMRDVEEKVTTGNLFPHYFIALPV